MKSYIQNDGKATKARDLDSISASSHGGDGATLTARDSKGRIVRVYISEDDLMGMVDARHDVRSNKKKAWSCISLLEPRISREDAAAMQDQSTRRRRAACSP